MTPVASKLTFRDKLPFLSYRGHQDIEICLLGIEAGVHQNAYVRSYPERTIGKTGFDDTRFYCELYGVFASGILREVQVTDDQLENLIPSLVARAAVIAGGLAPYEGEEWTSRIREWFLHGAVAEWK